MLCWKTTSWSRYVGGAAKRLVGNIYKGRVPPGIQAAFVDIGLERNAFLCGAISAVTSDFELGSRGRHQPAARRSKRW